MRGQSGPRGRSAYEIAVRNGFVGTEQQWLDSLKGVVIGSYTAEYPLQIDEVNNKIKIDKEDVTDGGNF